MIRRPQRRDVYGKDFADLCADLAKATREFAPDLVVGIQTGGEHVAELMLPGLGNPEHVAVRLQRPATATKSNLRLGAVVGQLPRPVVDALRWLEVEARELSVGRRESPVDGAAAKLARTSALADLRPGVQRVLVVDDTVDSGRTLSTVVRAVQIAQPAAEVRTAVLASTWRRPPVRPDYCLHERTLLRMPWSFDAAA